MVVVPTEGEHDKVDGGMTQQGGGGIRTHGPLRDSGFQDQLIKPL